MDILKAFIAGFGATLIFHQGALAMLYSVGLSAKPPFPMTATAPFKVPAVLSLAFWGGLWGIALSLLLHDMVTVYYLALAMAFGALAPSIIALFVVFPLKGMPVAGGWDPKIIGGALIVNGAWGFGTALLLLLMARFP